MPEPYYALRIPDLPSRAEHPAAGGAVALDDAASRMLVFTVLLSVTVLQRFALPLAGSEVGFSLIVPLGTAGLMVLRGRMRVNVVRLLLYLAMVAVLTVTLFLGKSSFSITSFGLLLAIYFSYVFQFTGTRADFFWTLLAFLRLMQALAVLGLAQFFLQFAFGPAWMFPFDRLLSPTWFLPNFNLVIPLYGGAPVYKSTGLFFLEPSHFSQFLGLAVLIELRWFGNRRRLACYGAGLFVAFSGTGLALVGLFGPFILARHGDAATAALIALSVLTIAMTGEMLHVEVFTSRLGEFGSPQASGFSRFVSPFWLLRDVVLDRPLAMIFGLGAGALTGQMGLTGGNYLAHDPSWFKLLFEYGLAGSVPFLAFFLTSLFHRTPSRTLSLVVLFTFLFLGGYLLAAYMHFLFLALLVWHRPADAVPPHGPRFMVLGWRRDRGFLPGRPAFGAGG